MPYAFAALPLIQFASVVGFLTLAANAGTVNLFDTFKKNSSKIRTKRAGTKTRGNKKLHEERVFLLPLFP